MSHMRRLSVFLCLAVAMGAAVTHASGPTFWTVATAADFLRGTSDGVFVTLGGAVTAGPPLTSRLQTTPAQVWSLATAPDGTLWAGTGGDGRLVRLRAGQVEETVFDAPEANVFAIAIASDRVYAASSPDGKVYVIEGTTPARVFFDPTENYIWALAVDSQGRVWVGTGNPAVLYRVSPDGTSTVIYRPPAGHVVSLATDAGGRVLAGTESPGRLYRFDQNDRPFVLLDSGLAELRAASADAAGVIFAAAVAKGDDASAGEAASIASATAQPAAGTATASAAPARRSALFRIDPSGTWEEIWASPDVIFDVAAQSDGGVLVGTGAEGRLYRVDATRQVHLFTGVDARQITRFAVPARGAAPTAFATANPGRVVAIGAGVQSPATYLSQVRDTESVATWGQVRWDATGNVVLSSRSGNTERPDDSWSDWSAPYSTSGGQGVTSPPARFIQWRAVLTRTTSGPASTLRSVTLAYLTRNNRPQVTSITTHPPGLVFQRPFVNDESAIFGLDERTIDSRRAPGDTGPAPPAPGRRLFQKGLQTIVWKAEDSDADELTYTLLIRRESETTWRELVSDVTETIYVWDTSAVADGRYFVRVRASDRVSNTADRALDGDRDSDPVEVDNTPPVLTINVGQNGAPTSVRVVDQRSPIHLVEYSIGGRAWQVVAPVDGLADSLDERYEIRLPGNTNPADVVVRAFDAQRNTVSQPAARP
jgi:sugar lactone lactonase YvrE